MLIFIQVGFISRSTENVPNKETSGDGSCSYGTNTGYHSATDDGTDCSQSGSNTCRRKA